MTAQVILHPSAARPNAAQLALPLAGSATDALRAAHARCHITHSFEHCLRIPALRIALVNLAGLRPQLVMLS